MYVICINSEQKTALTSLCPIMSDWIKETMNDTDEVWRRMHKNYGMSWIIWKFNSVKNKCTYLYVPKNVQLDQLSNECQWWSMNVSASKLWNEPNHTKIEFIKKQIYLPCCSRKCSIESTKQWMSVMKYWCECIKTMEWVKLYVNYIKSK